MGKPLIVVLIIAILALGGFAVYSTLPQITPQIQKIISWRPGSKPNPATTPTPSTSPAIPSPAEPSPTPEVSFNNSLTITDYLQAKVGLKGFDGNVYCAYEVLKQTGPKPDALYILGLCQEYYEKLKTKYPGTGLVVPISLTLKWSGESFEIADHKIPKMGSDYESSLKAMFPADLVQNIISNKYSDTIKSLQLKVDSAVY